MPDSLIQAIDAQLARYLNDEDSLADFEAWLVPETWDISPQTDRAAHELTTAITLRIAEFTNGDWTEDELKEALSQLRHPTISPLAFTGEVFMYSATDKAEHAFPGGQSHLARASVAGTGRSEVAA